MNDYEMNHYEPKMTYRGLQKSVRFIYLTYFNIFLLDLTTNKIYFIFKQNQTSLFYFIIN